MLSFILWYAAITESSRLICRLLSSEFAEYDIPQKIGVLLARGLGATVAGMSFYLIFS